MTLPTSQEYNEALQNPRLNFADAELKQGQPAVSPLGLPIVASGNFADVYRLDCGVKSFAVKCFTKEVAGRHDRYRAISTHLQQAKLPFTVEFQYLDKGIRVAGNWYPVLKMQWIEGIALNEFVRQKVDKPQLLEALIQLWLQMAQQLRDAQIAHADLQHGNVKMVPSPPGNKPMLRLLDYDGMHIPALAKLPSGENGHPNFQHPSRLRSNLYNGEVDRFPHLLICTALRALMVGGQPLWNRHDNGDNLLFKQADMEKPVQSKLLKELWQMSDPVVRTLAGHVVLSARGPLGQEPLIIDLLANGRPPVLTPAQEQQVDAVLLPGSAKKSPVSNPQPNIATKSQSPPLSAAVRPTPVPTWAIPTPAAPPSQPPVVIPAKKSLFRRRITLSTYALLVFALGSFLIGLLAVSLGGGGLTFIPVARNALMDNTSMPLDPAESDSVPAQTVLVEDTKPAEARLEQPTLGATSFTVPPPSDDFYGKRAGQERDDNSLKMKMIWCPPGSFTMGSPAAETGRDDDEDQVFVTLTRGFWLGKYEVTQGEWQAVMQTEPWKGGKNVLEGQNYPATYVGHADVTEFCVKLTEAERQAGWLPTGWEFRLPTEAQWEYACRADSKTAYPFGANAAALGDYAWVYDNADAIGEDFAHAVGLKKSNAWGLHDMRGNVWEWCRDGYGIYPPGGTDPDVTTTNSFSFRVFRGGSWSNSSEFCRVANRGGCSPGHRNCYLGFRVAADQVSVRNR